MSGVAAEQAMAQVAVWLKFKDEEAKRGMEQSSRDFSVYTLGIRVLMDDLMKTGKFVTERLKTMSKGFADYGANLNRSSREANVSVTWLEKMNYVLGLTGHSVQDLQGALLTMNQALHDAMYGADTPANRALRMLGIDVRELYTLTTSQRFEKIAERIMNIENASRRAGIAAEIFGDNAKDMMAAFTDEGGAQLQEYIRQAEMFGNQSSPEDLQLAREAEQSTFRMVYAWEKLEKTIGKLVTPVVIEVQKWLTALMETVTEFLEENPRFAATLGDLSVALGSVLAAVLLIVGAMYLWSTGVIPIALLVVAILGLMDVLGIVDTGARDFFESIRIGTNSAAGWWDSMTNFWGDRIFYVWDMMKTFFSDWKNALSNIWDMYSAIGKKILEIASFGTLDFGADALMEGAMARAAEIYKDPLARLAEGDRLRWEQNEDDREQLKDNDLIASLRNKFDDLFNKLDNMKPPGLGNTSSGFSPGVSFSYGVHGFMGGGTQLSEQLGAAYSGKNFEDRSIEIQQAMRDSLTRIDDNTRPSVDVML